MDWLNACHIDTPVVSPVGPQRHNGVGLTEPYAVQLFPPPPFFWLSDANSVTCWHCDVDDSFWFNEVFLNRICVCAL